MRKAEALKKYTVNKIDDKTIMISNNHFLFSFTKADDVCKPEYKGQYRYFGGLQCNFNEGSPEYINLEGWLCEIAEMLLP